MSGDLTSVIRVGGGLNRRRFRKAGCTPLGHAPCGSKRRQSCETPNETSLFPLTRQVAAQKATHLPRFHSVQCNGNPSTPIILGRPCLRPDVALRLNTSPPFGTHPLSSSSSNDNLRAPSSLMRKSPCPIYSPRLLLTHLPPRLATMSLAFASSVLNPPRRARASRLCSSSSSSLFCSLNCLRPCHYPPFTRVPIRKPRSSNHAHPITMVAGADSPSPGPAGQAGLAGAFVKFTRPHTIRGTILGSFAGCARALLESAAVIDWALLPTAVLGMLALLLGNAFIVGINQIYDVRVDKINKPFLPLAAGEMSVRLAWGIVVSSALTGLAIVRLCFSRLIFGLYAFGMSFGALYSIPPFRFKRYPALAAITISCVRGFLMNFGVYHATKSALGIPFTWSPPITFLAVFMTIFACVIALSKDLPDIKGDRAEGVPTFASRMGPRKLIRVVVALLGINYLGAIATAVFAPAGAFRRVVLGLGHLVLGTRLFLYQRNIDPNSQTSIKDFYRFIWQLFYSEYLLFPFI